MNRPRTSERTERSPRGVGARRSPPRKEHAERDDRSLGAVGPRDFDPGSAALNLGGSAADLSGHPPECKKPRRAARPGCSKHCSRAKAGPGLAVGRNPFQPVLLGCGQEGVAVECSPPGRSRELDADLAAGCRPDSTLAKGVGLVDSPNVRSARLAQLVEHYLDTVGVTSSSLVPRTIFHWRCPRWNSKPGEGWFSEFLWHLLSEVKGGG